jgi:hypothetical protein
VPTPMRAARRFLIPTPTCATEMWCKPSFRKWLLDQKTRAGDCGHVTQHHRLRRIAASVATALVVVAGSGAGVASATPNSSPILRIRPVLCVGAPAKPVPLTTSPPSYCPSHQFAPTTAPSPSNADGFTSQDKPDPALGAWATTTAKVDQANPNEVALLPLRNDKTRRLLVGPTQITLTPLSGLASARHCAACGGWIVTIRLKSQVARVWYGVAKANFHHMIAIDLRGVILTNPWIEPTSAKFNSFRGEMQFLAPTKSQADAMVKALRAS